MERTDYLMASNIAVTVTSTATLLLSAEDEFRPVYLQVVGNNTVYIGDSAGVTTANGFPIAKHAAPVEFQLRTGLALYGICAAGQTEEIRIFAPRD